MSSVFRSMAALTLLALLLAACGNSGTGATNGTAPSAAAGQTAGASNAPAKTAVAGASGERVTITYGIWDQTQQAAMQKMIDAFEQSNPGIHVQLQLTPWTQYWDNLKTAAAGGELFDVFWMNAPFFPFYASRGVLLDLTPYMQRDKFDPSKYPQSILEGYKYGGKQFGGPFYFDSIGLFYNQDMFDKAGIPYPDASWDWNKLRTVAKQLTQAPNQFGMVVWWNSQEQTFNFIYSNGGEVVANNTCQLDAKPSVDAVQYLVNLIYKDKVSQEPAAMGEDPTIFFQQGKAAMITTGSWNLNAYKTSITGFKWNVAPLPKAPTGKSVSVVSGLGNVVNAKTKHPDAAWAWVNFIASQAGQTMIAQNGQPPTYAGLAKPWQDAFPSFNTQVFLDAAQKGHPYPTGVNFDAWNQIINTSMADIFANRTPVETGLKQACQQINAIPQK